MNVSGALVIKSNKFFLGDNVKECVMCKYSMPAYVYVRAKIDGEEKEWRIKLQEYVKCRKIKEICKLNSGDRHVIVNKYFAEICPFYTQRCIVDGIYSI